MSGTQIASNTIASKSTLYLNRYQEAVNRSIERISSGKKVNSASDAPSEIGYINRFKSAINSTKMLNNNLQDNISMLQTADYAISGTGGISSLLSMIRERVVESQGIALSAQDKQNLQQEIEDIIKEIDEVASGTEFNTKKLLNGAMGAKVVSSDSNLDGYALRKVDSDSFHFENVKGATKHELNSSTAANGVTDLTGADLDYTKSLGVSGTFTLDGSAATTDGNFEMVFTSSSQFDIYNNATGVKTASGSIGNEFNVAGVGVTLASDGTYAKDYKFNFQLTNGSNALTDVEEGNRGTSGGITLAAGTWGDDSMMNSHFDVGFEHRDGGLKYAAFDPEGNRMGEWVASGSEFKAYEDSKLNGSTFTFTSGDAGVGDKWRIGFGVYTAVDKNGGSLSVENRDKGVSVSYTGSDRLSEFTSNFNSLADGIAEAEYKDGKLTITADDYGEDERLSLYGDSGNLKTALSITEKSGSGTDATMDHDGKAYESSDGYFRDIKDGMVFEVANDADIDSAYASVSNTSLHQAMNINGPDGIDLFIRDMSSDALGLKRGDGTLLIDVTKSGGGAEALSKIDSALDVVSSEATKVGSLINTLSSHTGFLEDVNAQYGSVLENHERADIPEETAKYFESTAMRDAAAAMTAQANLQPQRVLELLGLIKK